MAMCQLFLLMMLLSASSLVRSQEAASTAHPPHYRTVCYLEGWARYRPDPVTFHPEDLDTKLCTHVIYAFAILDKTGTSIVPADPQDITMYHRLNLLKRERPSLKTLLGVGGWNMGTQEFPELASSKQNMQTFATNAAKFLREHNFDGLDLDWEYPGAGDRGSPSGDKHHFTQLLKTLKHTFAQEHNSTNNSRLLLSAAIAPVPFRIEQSYELPNISYYVDFLNLMAYDNHGSWDSNLAHHSNLYPTTDNEKDSIDYNINFVLNATVPRSKLNLGLAFFGRSFNLSDPMNSDLGAPVSGGGGPGPLVGDPGVLIYSEVCKLLTENPDTVTSGRVPGTNAPYMVDGTRWTGYDDATSIKEKVDYVMQHGLGGVMIWTISMDDFHGICGQGHYPLMHAVREAYHAGLVGK